MEDFISDKFAANGIDQSEASGLMNALTALKRALELVVMPD
jgi:hypothetical protein